ncbi:MAG: YezD family protein [Verrucomicrobiota bacterium]
MKTNSIENPKSQAPVPDWLEVVRKNAEQLRYGSIQITVHDGRVTQVESIERTRFSPVPGR